MHDTGAGTWDPGVPLHQGHCFCVTMWWVDPGQYQIDYTHVPDTESSRPVRDSLKFLEEGTYAWIQTHNISRNEITQFSGFCAPIRDVKAAKMGFLCSASGHVYIQLCFCCRSSTTQTESSSRQVWTTTVFSMSPCRSVPSTSS